MYLYLHSSHGSSEEKGVERRCKDEKLAKENRTLMDKENSPVTLPVSGDIIPENVKKCASERNLGDIVQESNKCRKDSAFVLIDSSILCEFLDQNLNRKTCGGSLTTAANLGESKGFATTFTASCNHCETPATPLFTSSKTCTGKEQELSLSDHDHNQQQPGGPSPYEVNCRMVLFIRELGKGHSALRTFSRVLNSPGITQSAYDNLFEKIHEASELMAEQSMKEAAA